MAACPTCGEDNQRRARFCWACGGRLAGAPSAGSERKVVTVLFVDLVGFTGRAERLDPEDVSRVLRPYYARVRAELERFGGSVEKFIGDAVMALFGAPSAHEDDPERALRAAFAIRRTIDEMNALDPELDLQVRIGVNTGEALVDLDARPSAGEAMAAGDVVNTAARLQTAAPVGAILVGAATRRSTDDVVEYFDIGHVTAKGKHEPVRAWRALVLRPRHAVDLVRRGFAPLVGREQELELLLHVPERARTERRVERALLVGAPGIGKSRLLWELYHSLAAEPVSFLWRQGRCLPYGDGVSFWAFGEMVKTQAGILETDPADAAEQKLRAAVTAAVSDVAAAEWVFRHLRPLVGLGGDGPGHRGEAFAAWRRFVEALAGRQLVVLAFEDLHLADDGLLDFVEHLAEWVRGLPLALVCTARPELLERRPGWEEVLALEPLSRDDTATLLESLVGRVNVPEDLWGPLLSRAAGNPLYAEEYARMLAERGAEGELPLPESVQALIAARLDELPLDAKATLQDAAVVGKGFWVGALAHMAGASPDQVERRLDELQRRQLVRPQPRTTVAGEHQYAFWHVLVRDVAYGQIPRSKRAERHRLAAEWIESLAGDRALDLSDMLAHHYTSAIEYARLAREDTAPLAERARLALRDAGDRALALYSFAAARRFYEAALELWPADDPERPHLLLSYGKSRFWAEGAGEDVLAEARDALLAADDREAAAEAQVMISRLYRTRGDLARAAELAADAASLLSSSPPSPAKAEALSNLVAFLALDGKAEEAIAAGAASLVMAGELGLDEVKAHGLTFTGLARVTIGDNRQGIADLERSIQISRRLNSPEVVRGCANLASALANLGDLRGAWEFYAQGRRAAEQFGDTRGLRWLVSERHYEHYWRGEWNDALALAESVLAEPASDVEHHMAHTARHVRGAIRLARADTARALEDLSKALELGRAADDPQILFPSLALQARALLATGKPQDAAAAVDELLHRWRSSGTLFVYFWLADLVFPLHELGRGPEFFEVAQSARAATRWLDAARLVVEGKPVEAADLYAEIGALPEEALARQRAATALNAAGRPREAAGQAERALAFHRSVGAEAHARECEELLPARAS
jgi:class 3 adenylate cyclase